MQRVASTRLETANKSHNEHRGFWIQILIGFVSGPLIYFTLAAWPAVAIGLPGFGIHPLTMVIYILVSVAVVLIGVRWPITGITSGIIVLTIVAVAMIIGIGPVQASEIWDLTVLLGFSRMNGMPTIIGVVLICSSVFRRGQNHSTN